MLASLAYWNFWVLLWLYRTNIEDERVSLNDFFALSHHHSNSAGLGSFVLSEKIGLLIVMRDMNLVTHILCSVFDNKSKKWPKIILFSHVKSSISEKTAQKPRGCQLLGENWLETSSLLSSLSRHRLSTIDELILSFSSLQVFYWVFGSSRLAFLLFNTLLKEKSLQICIGAHSRRSKLKNGLSGGLVVL